MPIKPRSVPKAAWVLSRRFNGRNSYRRKRDRKIAEDWLGRIFKFKEGDDGYECDIRLTGYNPVNHTVVMVWEIGGNVSKHNNWSTDRFWKLIREGKLLP